MNIDFDKVVAAHKAKVDKFFTNFNKGYDKVYQEAPEKCEGRMFSIVPRPVEDEAKAKAAVRAAFKLGFPPAFYVIVTHYEKVSDEAPEVQAAFAAMYPYIAQHLIDGMMDRITAGIPFDTFTHKVTWGLAEAANILGRQGKDLALGRARLFATMARFYEAVTGPAPKEYAPRWSRDWKVTNYLLDEQSGAREFLQGKIRDIIDAAFAPIAENLDMVAEEETGKPATSKAQIAATQRYKDANYTRFGVDIDKALAREFTEAAQQAGVSRRQVLIAAMKKFIEEHR